MQTPSVLRRNEGMTVESKECWDTTANQINLCSYNVHITVCWFNGSLQNFCGKGPIIKSRYTLREKQ